MPGILTPGWHPRIQLGNPYAVDWSHPISFGLNYVYAANAVNQRPTFSRCALGTYQQRSNTWPIYSSIGGGGVGLAADNAVGLGSGLQWLGGAPTINQVAGTVMMYQTRGFADADGNYRFAFRIATGDGNSLLMFHIASFGTTAYGWHGGGGGTYATASAGIFAVGQTAVAGFTWLNPYAPGNQPLWMNGISNAPSIAPTSTQFDTTGFDLSIGNDDPTAGTSRSWIGNTGIGKIYWIAFWDRVLSDSELVYLNANPMCFLVPAEYEMPMLSGPPALRQKHFRFRTDTGAADAAPTWGALEDAN
jgi:hypothetical protein